MNTAGYKYLDLSIPFLQNINDKVEQNNNEIQMNNYEKINIYPRFRYYNDDTDLNLTSKVIPDFTYKNKSLFPPEKPIQTEQDEISVSKPALSSYYGYGNYGNYYYQNQSFPEYLKHKITPKNYLFDLV
jgi:hypothetical protein